MKFFFLLYYMSPWSDLFFMFNHYCFQLLSLGSGFILRFTHYVHCSLIFIFSLFLFLPFHSINGMLIPCNCTSPLNCTSDSIFFDCPLLHTLVDGAIIFLKTFHAVHLSILLSLHLSLNSHLL
ncbi:hypothetical protein BDA96_05G028000 [Sorghum bicolor]|uniref:Uncharacterized protein n=1 Tax=Sorghum bicolor TaxID=4558 RepID=A0A921UE30_SORBI|nr:hypothetical protein BDA96_05G028000 [Sorghum bicolor]